MTVQTTAGAKLYISPNLPVTEDASGYGAVTGFVEVTEITDFGDLVQEYTTVEHTVVGTRKTVTLKGTKAPVSFGPQIGKITTDAGQDMLKDAYESDDNYSFKITLKDGTTFYNYGLVINNPLTLGDANTVTGGTLSIIFNGSKMVEVGSGTFTLTYTADATGKIIGDASQEVVDGGNGSTVYAIPLNDATHVFSEWSDNASTDPERTDLAVSADVTANAIFVTV